VHSVLAPSRNIHVLWGSPGIEAKVKEEMQACEDESRWWGFCTTERGLMPNRAVTHRTPTAYLSESSLRNLKNRPEPSRQP